MLMKLYIYRKFHQKGKENISLKKCYDLIKNIKTILKNAIKAGGTTIKDHMQPDGI